MSKISTYDVAPVPKLADKLIGTSVGGTPDDGTYNFTLQELLTLFLPNIPANNLQGVLNYGNTATQDINLTGTIYTTDLDVSSIATILDSFLTGDTHITGGLYDVNTSIGTAGQVLTSTGFDVEWYTIPTVIPDLQQVLTAGNTSTLDIILTSNLSALDVSSDTATFSTDLTIDGTLTDGTASVGTAGKVLSSTGTGVQWVSLPVYSATSPLFFDSITGVFSIQVANGTQDGYLSSADWITFNGKQNAGNYITALTGEATATGPGSVAITLSNTAVIGKILTGLSITGAAIVAADTILQAFGKVQNQINGKQDTITLTTTGTSGAATLIGATLNIPQYTDAFLGTVTSVSFTLGGSGTDLNSSVVNSTTTPAITLNVPTASATNRGALSAADWTTFNSKQIAGNYITSLTGEATASGPGASAITLTNSAVIAKVLTGLNVTGGTVIAADNILAAFGKVQNQINGLIGGSIFQGVWNASTNTPALVSSVGTNGYYYIVSVAGSTNLDGITDWQIGDWAIFAGTSWQKVDNTDAVSSVNGFTGAVSLTTDNISEGATNLYFTNTRARTAISLTTTGSSGASTYDNTTGVFNIPTYTDAFVGTVTSVGLSSATSGVTIGSTPITTSGTITIAIATATSLLNGLLSSTDWTTFNNKQGTITLTTTGTSGAATFSANTLNIPQYADAYVGTVTSVAALTLGTTGSDLSSTVANGTTTPVITLQVPTASAANRGALSSADWTTFNSKAAALSGTINTIAYWDSSTTIASLALATYPSLTELSYVKGVTSAIQTQLNAKQATITLTTTGTSGAATFSSNTLNIPNYADGGVLSLSAIGATANANAATITGTVLNLQPADASFGGVVTTGTQTFAGAKTVSSTLASTFVGQFFENTGASTSAKLIRISNTSGDASLGIEGSTPTQIITAYGGVQYSTVLKTVGLTQLILGTNSKAAITIDSATQIVTLAAGLSGTTASFSGQLTLNSTITNGTYTYTLPSATGTLALVGGAGVGTVTSVAAITLGTTGSDLSSTVANGTTTPVITLQVPTASAANRGALSSADWSTFNGKQGTITLTTTGTSGAATFSANTLNIPNYADGGVLSLSAIGGTANANAATITGTVLNLQPADGSFGGVVTTGTQTFAGAKTLTSALTGTSATFSGQLLFSGNTSQTAGSVSRNSTFGLTLFGVAGSTYDFGLVNKDGNAVMANPTGTQNVVLSGALSATSATFSSSVTATAADAAVGLKVIGGTGRFVIYPYFDATEGVLINSYNTAESGYKPMSFQASAFRFSQGAATFTGNLACSGASIQLNQTEIFPSSGASNRAYAFNVCNVAAGDFTISQGSTATGGTYTTRLTINPTGNVGIGTTSPATFLQITGTEYSQLSLQQTGANTVKTFFGHQDNGTTITSRWVTNRNPYNGVFDNTGRSSGSIDIVSVSGGSSVSIATSNANNTEATTRLYVSNAGNVGIGTTSPVSKLTVFTPTTQSNAGVWSNCEIAMHNSTSVGDYSQIGLGYTTGTTNAAAFIGFISTSATANGKGSLVFGTRDVTTDTAPTTRLTIASTGAATFSSSITTPAEGKFGSVNIRVTSPAYDLQLSDDSAAKPSTNTWTIASDSRVKENITAYTKGLSAIMAINPVNYDYNGKAGFSVIKGNIGLIAQDVLEILPESVSTFMTKLNEDDEEKTELYNFNSHALTYILINAIKEQQAQIEELKLLIK